MDTPRGREGWVNVKVDTANSLWIACEKVDAESAIKWWLERRGMYGDHRFVAKYNTREGVVEVVRNAV